MKKPWRKHADRRVSTIRAAATTASRFLAQGASLRAVSGLPPPDLPARGDHFPRLQAVPQKVVPGDFLIGQSKNGDSALELRR